MEDILSQAITSILVNLQHQYANDPDALLYFCLNQSHMIGGLRSSVHSLNFNRPDQMVKQFMADFYHYINSNADVKLDATFECYFHIVSSKTLSKPGHRRTAVPVRSLVGGNEQKSKVLLKGSLINLPKGSPKNPNCFANACLLVTVVFMAIKKFQNNLYSFIRDLVLVKSNISQKNKACDMLLKHVNNLCAETNLNLLGPHELRATLKLLAQHYKANLIVITSLEGPKPQFISYPEKFDESKPRLYFWLQSNEQKLDHILAIDNISTFFKSFKKAICFKCNQYYCLRWNIAANRHKCRHSRVCHKCFGFSFDATTIRDSAEPWWYCDTFLKDIKPNEANYTCSKCGNNFLSTICYENHHKYFCKNNSYYYQCPVCQKTVAMRKRPISQVISEHHCGLNERFCKLCNKTLPINHLCTIAKVEKDKMWPNLAVISLTFEDAVGSMCQMCYTRQSKYMEEQKITYAQFFKSKTYHELLCDIHQSQKMSNPNVIKLFYEKDRFSFVGQTFSNNDFLAGATNLNESLYCSYSSTFRPKIMPSQVNTPVQTTPNLRSASGQLLHFLKTVDLAHYVFVVHSSKEMIWLLDFCLSNSLNPTAIQKGRVVKKISLPHRKINFVLFENYCKGSLDELSRQFKLRRSTYYFPMIYNQSQFYNQVIKLPPIDSFLTFEDTSEQVALKQEFYNKLPSNYNINIELYKVVTENLQTFLLSVIKFVDHSFYIQSALALLSKSNELAACHPFGEKIMSVNAFAMAVFKFYFYNAFEGFSVDKPYTGFYSKVSAPEYEYLSFLCYTKPEENIVYAFNRREGQMSFDQVIVDGYSPTSGTVYQFHGCMVS